MLKHLASVFTSQFLFVITSASSFLTLSVKKRTNLYRIEAFTSAGIQSISINAVSTPEKCKFLATLSV